MFCAFPNHYKAGLVMGRSDTKGKKGVPLPLNAFLNSVTFQGLIIF